MFIGKISKGRKVGEFIFSALLGPTAFILVWMCIFAGTGLRLEREGAGAGLCCFNQESMGNPFKSLNELTNAITNQDSVLNSSDYQWLCEDNECNQCAVKTIDRYVMANSTYSDLLEDYGTFGQDFTSILRDYSRVRLSCHQFELMWFNMMRSFTGIGHILEYASLLTILLYFVTSSDSGSLIVDCLSSNGDPDPPTIQRIFWSFIEGALATAILSAGDTDSLNTFRAVTLVVGLAYSVVVTLLCASAFRACQVVSNEISLAGPRFECGLLDCFFTDPIKKYENISPLRPCCYQNEQPYSKKPFFLRSIRVQICF